MDRRVKEENGVYMSKRYPNAKKEMPDGSQTLLQILHNKVREHADVEWLGSIKDNAVVYRTYGEMYADVRKLAKFLEGITADRGIVGLYSVNRMEWVMAEYAAYTVGCCNCPIYSTFTPEAIASILAETELEVLVTSAEKGHSLLKSVLDGRAFGLKHVVLMDEDSSLAADFGKLGIKAHLLSDILAESAQDFEPSRPEPAAGDTASICYTSGTSGNPKGVILSHSNFVSAITAFVETNDMKTYVIYKREHVYLSYLPLPHVLERICFCLAWASLAKVVFYRGNPKLLQEDMKIAKPTFIVTVPRVLNIFMEKIKATVAKKNVVVRTLFGLALRFKIYRQRKGVYKNWLLDKLIFNKVAAEFGGRLSHSLCGGASLHPSVLEYIEAVLSMKIFQGYGQTEGLAANIVDPLDSVDTETVGIPFPSVCFKLAPVEGYEGDDVGQLLMKGLSVTSGYYKKPKETKEVFTEDGWLKTGDVARVKNGSFYIIGRVKEMFKTSFGEYIIPEKVENCLVGGIIDDMFVTNTKFSDYLVAVVVCPESASHEQIVEEINRRGNEAVASKEMAKYEIPQYVITTHEAFLNLEGGDLITPSLKKRRSRMGKYFQQQIDALVEKQC
ncbi:long-chain acyl-CoA synthetase [Pancytospora philotis]|nr:long-chain acyl-CoA synthetase [Pancytospora philotis]